MIGGGVRLANGPLFFAIGQGRLIVRSSAGGRLAVTAVADQRVSPDGEPLYLRLGDTLARPVPTTLFDLPSDALAPEAPAYRVVEGDAPGVRVGSWPRRLALAWSLQAGDLLGNLPSGSRVDWRLSPEERL